MATDTKEQMEKAKNVRRAAKGKFTRSVKTVNVLRDAERPIQEIQEALAIKGNKGRVQSLGCKT